MAFLKVVFIIVLLFPFQLFAGAAIVEGEQQSATLKHFCDTAAKNKVDEMFKSDLDRRYFSCQGQRTDIKVDHNRPLEHGALLLSGPGYLLGRMNEQLPAEVRFTIPSLVATCSYRCPNTLSINIEIFAKHPAGVDRSFVPRELADSVIKVRRDCRERRSYSVRVANMAVKPPCYYRFVEGFKTFSTRVNVHADHYEYELRIRNLRKLHLKEGPKRLIEFHLQGPIQFQWNSIETDSY